MIRKLFLFHLLAVLEWSAMSSALSSCNFTSQMNEAIIYKVPGHYFNYDHKLSCNGAIAAWNYCYYTAELNHSTAYRIDFEIWREINRTLIQQIHRHSVHLKVTELCNTTFVCHREAVEPEKLVEEGDFIGVDFPSSSDAPIPVIGQRAEGSRLHRNAGSSSILFSKKDGLVLHANAEIVPPVSISSLSQAVSTTSYITPSPSTSAPITMSSSESSLYSRVHQITTTSIPLPSSTELSHPSQNLTITPSVITTTSNSSSSSSSSSNSSSIILSSLIQSKSVYSSFKDRKSTSLILTTTVSPSSVITDTVTTVTTVTTTSSVVYVTDSSYRVTSTLAMLSQDPKSTESSLHWPFTVGVVAASVLLVLIVIVSLLLVFVVSMRRGDVEHDKYGTEREANNLYVVSEATRHRASQGESSSIELSGSKSSSCKITSLLKTPVNISDESEPPTVDDDTHNVYAAPSKISPTSNSSVCSIFSGSETTHQRGGAQPYETPLATPHSSRLNLFASTSTLNTTCTTGSEVIMSKTVPIQLQYLPHSTMTLNRIKEIHKKRRKPLPTPTSTKRKVADKEQHVREQKRPTTETIIYSKPRLPTPEPTNNNNDVIISAEDEGYCTVRHPVRLLEQATIDTNIPSSQDMYCIPPDDESDIMMTLEKMNVTNISRDDIQVISHIGTGEFGCVAKAYWKRQSGFLEVAVKSMPAEHTDTEDRIKLLQEAVMMGQFRHPNVVQLHGIATAGTAFMLVLGFLAKGDLRTHLLQMNKEKLLSSTDKLLTSYSQQVALGMHYLASKGFVHRDLAARNIFVSETNTCKVGDFGMSRDLANAPYYISKGGKIPVRWTAPEAMYYHKYSSASDVWSYGCVLYEIWSLGRLPFKKYTNAQVLERLDSGHRLPPPPGTPRAIYELMIETWHPNPHQRPEFRDILVQLVQDEKNLLHIPVRDASTSQQASQLGSPLTAGEYMYSDLQRAYLMQQKHTIDEVEYDSLIGRKYVLSFPTSSADIDYLYNDCKISQQQRSFRSHLMTSDTESEYEDLSGKY